MGNKVQGVTRVIRGYKGNVKMKISIVTLITSYTNLATLKPDTHSSVQTLFFTYLPDILICHFVYEVHGL